MAHPMQSLKNALLNSVDIHLMPEDLRLSKAGTLEVRRSYFYRMGMTAKKWFEIVEKAALNQGFEISGYADDRYAIYPKPGYFVAVITDVKQPEYLPGGDAGCFPEEHPRPTIEDEPRSPAGGGNPETLGQKYCEWSDRVNQGWTAAETIAELQRQNAMLHDIVAGLRDSLSQAERELVRLHHRPAARR